ncbi:MULTISPECIES: aminotransferase class I/II-fold pyridoxal phosphate-dependent enzyme [Dehalococcoides]|jgi:Aspartate/tyrosine/aromatic aminotransferase|uniref:Aminotransferase n=2 Tax=root TaxID=1 RepID=A0A0V8M2Y7_9CHLR|nr:MULTISPECIES: aminotransferase class I/II-fold pyridoxal phosphate-dependent enzyme [Dehalococcoides]AII59887.1 aminotransferase [Dehalococcoides mccartyi CG4]KSV18009.1 aromatic amino acid aminotransferase [Dehalococcoides mccartyi]MDN4186545.1 aminotransferase class I/II-fold pyridoxal phosphate-dependent enzyme [Dehalococcoides mccartyi]MEA4879133.1 aminotransferase class I/II-fold pyridoxal phosphate-dependent enzyme [Dehalococcoides mccartyi]OBW61477.1 MAG: aromatic amino acid aminotra
MTSQVETDKGFISDRAKELKPSGIRKFFDLAAKMGSGAISLGVGEPDFTTPWHIRESAIYALEKGYTMYTSNAGLLELRQEIAKYLYQTYKLEYNPETEILITVGSSEALDLVMRATLNPGDEVLMTDPAYVAYPSCVFMAYGNPVQIPTFEANNFEISAADIAPRITPKTRSILLGYPSNPTGAVMPKAKLAEIAKLVCEKNLLVVSDEIYDKIIYSGFEHTCFATLPGMRERSVIINGFSKTYAMTGWRIGYAAGPADIIQAMTKIHQHTMLCAPIAAQKAALEALKNGQDDVRLMVEEYDRRRRFIVKSFNDMGLSCFEPKGAFYTFPSVKKTGLSSAEFAEKLLLEEKVAAVPGTAFGDSGEGYLRCCYATSMKDIEEAMKRFRHFLKHNCPGM